MSRKATDSERETAVTIAQALADKGCIWAEITQAAGYGETSLRRWGVRVRTAGRRGVRRTDEERRLVCRMVRQGLPYAEISRQTGIPLGTIGNWACVYVEDRYRRNRVELPALDDELWPHELEVPTVDDVDFRHFAPVIGMWGRRLDGRDV